MFNNFPDDVFLSTCSHPFYARCVRIVRSAGAQRFTVNTARLEDDAERALYAAVQKTSAASIHSIDELMNTILPLIPAITTFFDKVLVMADDPLVRQNRLGMLQQIASLAEGQADLAKLEGF